MHVASNNLIDRQNNDFLLLIKKMQLCKAYRELCLKKNIQLDKITSINEIQSLPLIDKGYLSINNSSHWKGVRDEKIVRIHATSGTTGLPVYIPSTKNDLDNWSTIIGRLLLLTDVSPSHTILIALPYGMFTGGLGFHYGAEKIGCVTIPAGASNTNKHIEIIENLHPDILIATPSYGLHLLESYFQKTKKASGFKLGIFGGECWTEESKVNFEQTYNIKAYNCYGLTEIMGPGVACETPQTKGKLVVEEDYFFPEIINPITLEQVKEGEWGELVITTLKKEAAPLIRYRTRDITRFTGEKYNGFRLIDRIKARTDDLLTVRGVSFYPMRIEEIIFTFPEISSNYLIEISRPNNLDQLTIKLSFKLENLANNLVDLICKKIKEMIKSFIGISVEISLTKKEEIPLSLGKAKRVLDLRK
jgi:phenylacetate-CoA ligase